MTFVWDFIKNNISVLSLLLPLLLAGLSAFMFFDKRDREQRQQNFENYHKLLQLVSEGKENGELLKSVCQRAFCKILLNDPRSFVCHYPPDIGKVTLNIDRYYSLNIG